MNNIKNENAPAVTSESSIQSLEQAIEFLRASPLGEFIKEIVTIIEADDVQVSGVVLVERKVYERELLPMDHIIISVAGLHSALPPGVRELED